MSHRRGRDPKGASLWLVGALLLLVPPAIRWARLPVAERFALPATPIERTNLLYAEQWRFLWKARRVLPPGASYTTHASRPEEAESLFRLSLAVLPELEGAPSIYYGVPNPERAAAARFVLDFRCHLRGREGLRRIARFREGCVRERTGEGR